MQVALAAAAMRPAMLRFRCLWRRPHRRRRVQRRSVPVRLRRPRIVLPVLSCRRGPCLCRRRQRWRSRLADPCYLALRVTFQSPFGWRSLHVVLPLRRRRGRPQQRLVPACGWPRLPPPKALPIAHHTPLRPGLRELGQSRRAVQRRQKAALGRFPAGRRWVVSREWHPRQAARGCVRRRLLAAFQRR